MDPITSYLWIMPGISYYKGLMPYADSLTGLYGYKNGHGKTVIPCRFVSAGAFSDGLAAVKLTQESMQYINERGKVVLDFPEYYDSGLNFKNGVAIINGGLGYGLIDKKGKYVIPPLCYNLNDAGNFYIASENDGYASSILFDNKGQLIDKRVFNTLRVTSNNSWIANYHDRFGYLDINGKELTPFIYSDAYDFFEGLAAVQEGKRIVSCRYYEAGDVTNGFGLVGDTNGRYGFVNAKGIESIPCKYQNAFNFSQGLAAVTHGDYKWGFIDVNGKEKIPCKLQQAR
ncbi:MAG: WG repeat-containing protein [Bacteroidota bacterium]|nr:WG repeat-containing protein [Bacteroidota bacterium]